MNPSTAHPVPDKQDAWIAEFAEAFSSGYTLGDIYDYSERDYEAVYALGHGFYRQARYLDALKAFTFLTMHQPIEPRFFRAQASCLQMLEQYEQAISFYSTASVLDLTDPRPYFHTAECLIALGHKEAATDALQLAIKHCISVDKKPLKDQASALLELLNNPRTASEGT